MVIQENEEYSLSVLLLKVGSDEIVVRYLNVYIFLIEILKRIVV